MFSFKVTFYLEKYILCWPDYTKFVPKKHHALVWFMKALRGCEVNQIFTHNKHKYDYNRDFQRRCDAFEEFIAQNNSLFNFGVTLTNDLVYMNLLSSQLVSNIHSDSELPSLVLKTRLLLQHFSLAAIKLWQQMLEVKQCRLETQQLFSDSFLNETEEEKAIRMSTLISHNCCPVNNMHICDLNNERRYQNLANNAQKGFYIEGGLLIAICFNTILLAYLLLKTRRNLSTATVLFVFNIMFFKYPFFMFSFTFFFSDFLGNDPYGAVNEDYQEKSPELVIAETLQTHLFASAEFRKHLIQETLYSLAQNGSLTGLIHLLVLVLVVINRSMSGKSIHLSRLSVISVFACVWIFLIASHAMFSTMQMSAIQNLDELFLTLAKGRGSLKCNRTLHSGYEEIASHCDRTAVFHAFGAYLLRGHTMFTVLFLSASIIIFVITVTYHLKVRRQHEIVHTELRAQSPHRRRERLFHTLILSIVTFFLSVMGQTYIEIAVFWVNEREDIATLSKWYHYARILAFVDPVLNPLIVVARTPALRRQLRSQWTSLRSRASSKTRSRDGNSRGDKSSSRKLLRSSKRKNVSSRKKELEVNMPLKTDRPWWYSVRLISENPKNKGLQTEQCRPQKYRAAAGDEGDQERGESAGGCGVGDGGEEGRSTNSAHLFVSTYPYLAADPPESTARPHAAFYFLFPEMKHLGLLLLLVQGGLTCFPTSQRSYQYGTPTQQFAGAQQPVAVQPQVVAAGARIAPAGHNQPIPVQGSSFESLLGQKVALAEFTADGYNAEGGGPVTSGSALTCNFDGRPCCWANVPPPEDQLDWHTASGVPTQLQNRNVPIPTGSYLVAYAKGAAPSDEAQFASCSIGCASSDIIVRAKHWQSENVLLQVCLRESFPTNADRNPLLNCQEFPNVNGMGTTEVVLPKTSLVDIVFVASNFVGEQGDIALLDDIEVSYDRNGEECQNQFEEVDQEVDQENLGETSANAGTQTRTAAQGQKTYNHWEGATEQESAKKREKLERIQGGEGHLVPASERFGSQGFRGGEKAFGGSSDGSASGGSWGAAGAKESVQVWPGNAAVGTDHAEETVFTSVKTAKLPDGKIVAKGAKTADFSESICNATKCLTTKFRVVSGQFMNRVTGVKESIEGDYYAATFLFPREMAGLEATTEPFTEVSRLRFQYYEGTHGVQLKGCCSTIENCPFSSDRFVTVSDRVWKTASFKCPKGTDKVIFLCENTRTNQGACAVDDLGLFEADGSLKEAKPMC
ncbi:unnamed protein product [Caenorhabditis auriculariae]|uniref:G-protein coupled receptors family 1 profile domain-containing protein n=1 Tax=Caenorhabditis auriculariae TaxID=2777116 RepID=A0A8S1GZG5_9PELO|nr:unnamed protein product [Caenorhabditis auriculariae]